MPGKEPFMVVGYRSDIDGLRAVSVVAVVLFHAMPTVFTGGFVGVDVFFVISGYLITSLIDRESANQSFTFSRFYARRIRRIFPALAIVLCAVLAYSWAESSARSFAQVGAYVAGGAAFIANYIALRDLGYFDSLANSKPLLHLWSLGIEEQFYIFWPAVLLFARRRNWPLVYLCNALLVVSFVINLWLCSVNSFEAFYLPQARFWELLAGASLALCNNVNVLNSIVKARLKSGRYRLVRLEDLESGIGISLIVLAFVIINPARDIPGWWAMLPVIGALCLIDAGPAAWVNRRVLSTTPLVMLGLISFPLYLWHWPMLVLLGDLRLGVAPLPMRLATVLISVILAWLTWQCIEQPTRRSDPRGLKAFVLAAILAILGVAGLYVDLSAGMPQRMVAGRGRHIERARIWIANDLGCEKKTGLLSSVEYPAGNVECSISDISAAPQIALIGDSAANHLYPGLSAFFAEQGLVTLNMGGATCPTFINVIGHDDVNRRCTEQNRRIYAYLEKTESIKVVIFAMLAKDIHAVDVFGLKGRSDIDKIHALEPEFDAEMTRLERLGKRIIVSYDSPAFAFDVSACASRSNDPACTISLAETDADQQSYFDAWTEFFERHPEICVFHQRRIFIDSRGNYRLTIDDLPVFRDDHHYSQVGSVAVAKAFARSSCYQALSNVFAHQP